MYKYSEMIFGEVLQNFQMFSTRNWRRKRSKSSIEVTVIEKNSAYPMMKGR